MSLLKKIWDEVEIKRPIYTGSLFLGLCAISSALLPTAIEEANNSRVMVSVNDVVKDKQKIEGIQSARNYRDGCVAENMQKQLQDIAGNGIYKSAGQSGGLPILRFNQQYTAPQTITPDLKAVNACFKHHATGGHKAWNLLEKAYIGLAGGTGVVVLLSAASFAAQRRRKNKGQDSAPAL